jgi:hypothetical protein
VPCETEVGWCSWLSHHSQLIVKELFLQNLLAIHLADLKPLAPKVLSILPSLTKGKAEVVGI